jgi:hypothetical protein
MGEWKLWSALDELLALVLSVADGGEYNPESLLARLAPARESIVRVEKWAALFVRLHPDEVELDSAMSDAVDQLKEALGTVFLCLTEGKDLAVMGEVAQQIAYGGATAVACLKAMDSVAEAKREYSESLLLETLFQAVKANDSAVVDAALALAENQQALLGKVRRLGQIFAPHSWREGYLKPMLDALEEMEGCRESLLKGLENGGLAVDHIAEFQSSAVKFDALEEKALAHLRSLESLPEAGGLRELMVLLSEVYERRAPISALKSELEGLVTATNEYFQNLDEQYGCGDERSAAVEEFSEALKLLRHVVDHHDVAHFPVLWDRLLGPAEILLPVSEQS